MVNVSYMVNIIVLAPVIAMLLVDFSGAKRIFGADSTARQILLSVYISILIVSVYALVEESHTEEIAIVLFPFQVIYKLLSAILIKDKSAPVLWFNLGIAALHAVTIYTFVVR